MGGLGLQPSRVQAADLPPYVPFLIYLIIYTSRRQNLWCRSRWCNEGRFHLAPSATLLLISFARPERLEIGADTSRRQPPELTSELWKAIAAVPTSQPRQLR